MTSASLIQRTGRAAFWNSVLFPLKALIGLAFTVVLARWFSVDDIGIYAAAMGVVTTVAMFTSIGIPTSLTKFLPEIQATAGPAAVVMFLRRVALYRLLPVVAAVLLLNLFPAPVAAWLNLGAEGVFILRLVSILALMRAVFDLCVKALNAFFGQLQSNLLDLLQGVLDLGLTLLAVALGYSIGGVMGTIATSAVVCGVVAMRTTGKTLKALEEDARGSANAPPDAAATRAAVTTEGRRFTRFALFTYVFELSIYFSGKSFANPALAVILGTEAVGIFTVGFSLAFMSIDIMVASFRGLYRPMFAHLRARRDPAQLRRAFRAVSKAQLVILAPAGVGLLVMLPDYIPLLYGIEFLPAIPIAQTFVVLMYTQSAFNLGMIWLSIDERYRAVLCNQSLLIVAAPLFLIVAGRYGLMPAALLFGGVRLVVSFTGYLICRRDYGFRFPWAFGGKILGVTAVMAGGLIAARAWLPQSPAAAIGLTLLGAIVYIVGLRLARILGDEEVDLLERSNIPGKNLVLGWLAPER